MHVCDRQGNRWWIVNDGGVGGRETHTWKKSNATSDFEMDSKKVCSVSRPMSEMFCFVSFTALTNASMMTGDTYGGGGGGNDGLCTKKRKKKIPATPGERC